MILLSEAKLIYTTLHENLKIHPELIDTNFMIQLQTYLQQEAKRENIDISDHSEWEKWLGKSIICSLRNG